MKFNPSKKILVEDMPEAERSWIGKLIDPLNQFMEKTSAALTGGLVLADNNRALVKQVAVAASQTYPMTLNVAELKSRPVSVSIGELRVGDATTPSAAFSVHWTYGEGSISFTFLGLDSSKTYTATLIILT